MNLSQCCEYTVTESVVNGWYCNKCGIACSIHWAEDLSPIALEIRLKNLEERVHSLEYEYDKEYNDL